ncbi:MAG: hypothetical protein WD180_05080 [Pseudohongiellaceae bacterium]
MATRAKSLGSWFDKRFQDWLRRHLPATDSITLNRRIIFILPTRQGMLFVAAAAVVFVAAINYAISLGFALAFLMASLFIISILHGFNNLNGLELTGLPVQSAFVGEDIGMNVLLSRNSRRRHEALELRFPGSNITRANVVSHDQEKVSIYIKATRRGRFGAPRLRVESTFPLGLTRAWSIVDLNLHSLIYPKPVRFQLERLNRSGGDTGDAVRIFTVFGLTRRVTPSNRSPGRAWPEARGYTSNSSWKLPTSVSGLTGTCSTDCPLKIACLVCAMVF